MRRQRNSQGLAASCGGLVRAWIRGYKCSYDEAVKEELTWNAKAIIGVRYWFITNHLAECMVRRDGVQVE